MTPEERAVRLPRNAFERILFLHGRRFWLCTVAGVTIFVVGTLSVLLVWALEAKVETARLIVEICIAYFAAAVAVVTVFTTGNTATDLITRRAANGDGAPPPPRASGALPSSSEQ